MNTKGFFDIVNICFGLFEKDQANFLNKFQLFAEGKYTELVEVTKQFTSGIRSLTNEFVRVATEKGITLGYSNEYGVDADIFNWIPNATVNPDPVPTGDWSKVDTKNGTSEKVMLETAIKMSLSQAIIKFTEMVKNGEFDKLETYRIIFLTETNSENTPLELVCGRRSDGELILNLGKVASDYAWNDAGRAWFSSNKTV